MLHDDIHEILSSVEVNQLRHRLNEFEIRLRVQIPDSALFTPGGEPNLRNRYGAVLYHVRQLQSIMSNFGFRG